MSLFLRCGAALSLLLFLAFPALAQYTGTLAGSVTDEAGSPVVGASVALWPTPLGAITDEEGRYVIRGIPAGTYAFQVAHVDHDFFWVYDLVVPVGQVVRIDAVLPPNDLVPHYQVELTYAEYLAQAEASSPGDAPTLVTRRVLQTRPFRELTEALAYEPGVFSLEGDPTAHAGFEDGSLPVAGGITASPWYVRGANGPATFYLDGIRMNGTPLLSPAAVAHLQLDVTPQSVRYGSVATGVAHVTTEAFSLNGITGYAEGLASSLGDPYGYQTASLTAGVPLLGGRIRLFGTGTFEHMDDADPRALGEVRLKEGLLEALQASPQAVLVRDADGAEFYTHVPAGVYDYFEAAPDVGGGWRRAVDEDSIANYIARNLPEGLTLVDAHPTPRAAPLTYNNTHFTRDRRKRGLARDRYDLYGSVALRPLASTLLRVGGRYFDQDRQRRPRSYALYAPDDYHREHTTHWQAAASLTQHFGPKTFLQVHAHYRDQYLVRHDPAFSEDIEETLFYEDLDAPQNAVARRYLEYDQSNHVYELRYSDGILPDASDIHSTWAAPGIGAISYYKQEQQAWRVEAHLETEYQGWHLAGGFDYEQETVRAFNLFGTASLARYYVQVSRDANGNLLDANGDVIGTGFQDFEDVPDNLVGDIVFQEQSEVSNRETWAEQYTDLAFQTMDDNALWFGYNYLGTQQADDEDVTGFANRTNTDLAPFQPRRYGAYAEVRSDLTETMNLGFDRLEVYAGLRVDGYDSDDLVLYDPYSFFEIERAGALEPGRPATQIPGNIGDDFAVYRDGQDQIVGYRSRSGVFYDVNGQGATASQIRQNQAGTPTVTARDPETGDVLLQITPGVFREREPDLRYLPRFGFSLQLLDQYDVSFHYARYVEALPVWTHNTIQEYQQATEGSEILGNSALKRPTHTEYRLGGGITPTPMMRFGITAFLRSGQDMLSRRIVQNAFPNNYQTWRNVDDYTFKGLTLEAQVSDWNGLSLQAHYTRSTTRGTGGDASAISQITWRQETDPFYPRFVTALDSDRPHQFKAALDFDMQHLFDGLHEVQMSLFLQRASGLPYSPRTDDSPIYTPFNGFLEGEINGERMPAYFRADLGASYTLRLPRQATLTFYGWIQNITDRANVIQVYSSTGSPEDDGFLEQGTGQDLVNSISSSQGEASAESFVAHYNAALRTPLFYGAPRQIRLGVRLGF